MTTEESFSGEYQKNLEIYIKSRYPGHHRRIQSLLRSRKFKKIQYPCLFSLLVLGVFSFPFIILMVIASVDLGSLNEAVTDERLQLLWVGLGILYSLSTVISIVIGVGVGAGKSQQMLLEAEKLELAVRSEFSTRVTAIRGLLVERGSFSRENLWEEVLLDDLQGEDRFHEPRLDVL